MSDPRKNQTMGFYTEPVQKQAQSSPVSGDDEKLARLIESYLEPHQPADYRLNVSRQNVQRSNGWTYIVVEPSKSDARMHDYNERLAATEEDIEANENLKVLLVPILPE